MKKEFYKYLIFLIISFLLSSGDDLFAQQKLDDINNSSKSIILTYPRGTETFYFGDVLKIEWNSKNVSKINIEFLNKDGVWVSLAENIDSKNNFFNLTITSEIPDNTKLRIIDSQDSNIFDATQFYLRFLNKFQNRILTKTNQLDKLATTTTPLRIMPLGDSITEGYPDALRNSYRKKLKSLLDNNGLNIDFIGSLSEGSFTDNQHEGHGGFSAKYWYPPIPQPDMYTNLNSYLTATNPNHPDVILFHIGTNDINDYRYSGDDNVATTTVADVSLNLNIIYAFDPNIIVILAKIINRTDDVTNTPSFNESTATTQFNIALASMASARSEYGTKLFLVDMESALSYPTDLADLLHPTTSGYEKMAPVWFAGIRNILPKLSAKIFLEGAFNGTNLNQYLNIAGVIPTTQPFNISPWNYNGTENTGTIPANVVDWVLVSLRTGTAKSSEISSRAGFVKTDGTIVDLDGISPLAFIVATGSYYVVVEHRNHLPIMSAAPVPIQP